MLFSIRKSILLTAYKNGSQLKILLFISIFIIMTPFAIANEQCGYIAKATEQYQFPQWEVYENCARYENGKLIIAPDHLQNIKFDSFGIAAFWVQGQYFYVKKGGTFIPVIFFDNGPDYFEEGLTRSLIDKKIAYYNRKFELIIPPKYDWGWPFSEGRALVCSGCRIQQPDKSAHKRVEGGVWGYIDKAGKEIVPVKYSAAELPIR